MFNARNDLLEKQRAQSLCFFLFINQRIKTLPHKLMTHFVKLPIKRKA